MSVDCDAKRDDVGGDESARDLERLLLLSDTCWDASHLQSSHRGSTGPRCDKRSESLHTRVSSEETKEAEHHSLKGRRWEERRRGGEGTQWSEWNQHHGESPRYTLLPRRRSIYILQNKKTLCSPLRSAGRSSGGSWPIREEIFSVFQLIQVVSFRTFQRLNLVRCITDKVVYF